LRKLGDVEGSLQIPAPTLHILIYAVANTSEQVNSLAAGKERNADDAMPGAWTGPMTSNENANV
jgi:hypothetical protein